jgi:hypothetical protein
MSSPLRWPDAALAGLACSMRSMSGPAVLAARGRVSGKLRPVLLLGAAGELGVDKSSLAMDRTEIGALVGRVGSGAYTGNAVAGPIGALVAATSAGVGTYSTWRIRKLVVAATGLPDPVIAAVEDILCYAAAAAATHAVDEGEPRDAVEVAQVSSAVGSQPPRPSLLRDAGKGLVSGVAGTLAMTITQRAELVPTSAAPSDAPATVAEKVSRQLGLGRIKRRDAPKANQGMHWVYATTWGIPYGIFAANSKLRPEVTGPAFGLVVWLVALGQQPAVGVAEVPWKRSLQSLGSEALFHVVYGVGAGAAMRALRNT